MVSLVKAVKFVKVKVAVVFKIIVALVIKDDEVVRSLVFYELKTSIVTFLV